MPGFYPVHMHNCLFKGMKILSEKQQNFGVLEALQQRDLH